MGRVTVNYRTLDQQLAAFTDKLTGAVGLNQDEASKVATLIASEVRFLDPKARDDILAASPVPLRDRLAELVAFQGFMEAAAHMRERPAVVRAQVIVQSYVCFVYLGEACFRALLKTASPGSVTRRCCKYLTDNPVRAFRNAIAHSNWTYAEDFSGLVYWARKGAGSDEPLSRFEVAQPDLDLWQMLSRAVAYASYTTLDSVGRLNGC